MVPLGCSFFIRIIIFLITNGDGATHLWMFYYLIGA